MFADNSKKLKLLNVAFDLVLTLYAFILAQFIVSSEKFHFLYAGEINNLVLLFILPLWFLFLFSCENCYSYRFKTLSCIAKDLCLPIIKSSLLLLGLSFLLNFGWKSRLILFTFFGVDFIFLTGFRKIIDLLLTKLREKGSGWKKVLLVGTGQMAKDFIIKIRRHPEWGVKILGSIDWEENRKGKRYLGIPVVGTLSSLPTILKNNQVDCVVYAVPPKFMDAVQKSVLLCEKMGVTVNMVADYFSHRFSIRRLKDLENKPEICFYSGRNRSFFIFLKSILDKVLALMGILLSFPIMLFTALLIKFTTPGPVFFKQKRCGANNRRFTFYKFRTMVKNAEVLKKDLLERNEMDGAAFKIKDDPRITGVGKYLRKFSLDELPQLFNVLLGDMSLVGPRPPLPQEVSRYEDWQRRRLSVKPGITCLWQISGRNEIGFKRWMEMDLKYIDNWSLGLDIQILFKTIPAVFLTKGAR